MKKLGFLSIIILFLFPAKADEGMWLPYLLKQLNEKDMQLKGMKITAEDIYSINNSSLKDAIVLFGGGCTGEIVSNQGLLLTNHHCGYSIIQSHSNLENNYLQNGFWAMNKEQELPNPHLSVTILVYMKDVSKEVLENVSPDLMNEKDRAVTINKNIDKIIKEATEGTHYTAVVKPIYGGNQYLLFVNEVFKDVRLVGAPPSSIGKFGGDTDNWMWPRHTGDFAVFRIYTDKDGKPAPYAKDNIPYKPKKHLKITLKGAEADDFTFVFGYPGTTQQFTTSWNVDLIQNHLNPIAIDLRTKRLDIINRYMKQDELTRIQYAAKAATIANGWKKWIGENKGLQRLDVINKKKELEQTFTLWINQNNARKERYKGLLTAFENFYTNYSPTAISAAYFRESVNNIELLNLAVSFNSLINESIANPNMREEDLRKLRDKYINSVNGFYKNYNIQLDKEIFILLMNAYYAQVDKTTLPLASAKIINQYKGDFNKMADVIYAKSLFADYDKLISFVSNYKPSQYKTLLKDPAHALIYPLRLQYIEETYPKLLSFRTEIDSLERIWIAALMEMQPEKTFYPDANLTLRVTYGKVDGFFPADGVKYAHYTTLKGVMQKEATGIYDYVVEDKLKELYNKKDYGDYADGNGDMPVAFIASNHTTGGNSGSPILNAEGHLLGLNFDRCWEGTMSDIQYDPDLCRNISVDIRYVLFIIDKYAGAKHLIDEMDIVKN
ncbi:MAG TPA: S46 family peptidase [Bacteroidales bacterium]|nr:S46 family peptidase [Bacteroidales bacterium]